MVVLDETERWNLKVRIVGRAILDLEDLEGKPVPHPSHLVSFQARA